MEAADATALGSWATVRGYFTPATLFLVLNLVIGTIALTSRSHQRRRREHHHDYAAAPPLDPHHQQQDEFHLYFQPQPQYVATPPPAPLARTSSVLDRLRSIGLYRFRSGDFPPEYGAGAVPSANHDVFAPVDEETTTKQQARSWSEPAIARVVEKRAPPRTKPAAAEVRKAQVARPPAHSRVVQAVAEDVVDARAEQFITASLRQPEPVSPPKAEYHYQAETEVSRTSSVLERLRSISLYSFLGAADQPAAAAATDAFITSPADDKKPAHYDRSRSEPAREQGKKEKKQAAEAKMAKSSSSASRKPAAPKLVEEECVDARAEAFIDSFRRGQSQKQAHRHDDAADDEEHAVVPPPAPPLARTSSVLDRLRSFSLYLRSGDAVPEDPVTNKASSAAAAADEKKQMSKTSSVAAAAPAEECVDARADDFINKFRQQLQLQRLNSLLGGAKQQ